MLFQTLITLLLSVSPVFSAYDVWCRSGGPSSADSQACINKLKTWVGPYDVKSCTVACEIGSATVTICPNGGRRPDIQSQEIGETVENIFNTCSSKGIADPRGNVPNRSNGNVQVHLGKMMGTK